MKRSFFFPLSARTGTFLCLCAIAGFVANARGEESFFGQHDLEVSNTRAYLLALTYPSELNLALNGEEGEILNQARALARELPQRLQAQGIEDAVVKWVRNRPNALSSKDLRRSGGVFYIPLMAVSFVGSASFVAVGASISFNGYTQFVAKHAPGKPMTDDEISSYLNDDAFRRKADLTVKQVAEVFALTAEESALFKEQFMEDLFDEIGRNQLRMKKHPEGVRISIDPMASLAKVKIGGSPVLPQNAIAAAQRISAEVAGMKAPLPSFQEELAFQIVTLIWFDRILQSEALPPEGRELFRRATVLGKSSLRNISDFYAL